MHQVSHQYGPFLRFIPYRPNTQKKKKMARHGLFQSMQGSIYWIFVHPFTNGNTTNTLTNSTPFALKT